MKKYYSICLAIVFLCVGVIPAMAQNAALVGSVKDAQQALIPGANLTLKNNDTGVELTTKTDESGAYEFPTVRPGSYLLKAEKEGLSGQFPAGAARAHHLLRDGLRGAPRGHAAGGPGRHGARLARAAPARCGRAGATSPGRSSP